MRKDYNIDEEEFDEIMDKFESELYKYIEETFLYDYVAFYIARGFHLNTLWEGSFKGHVNSALDSLCSLEFRKEDYKILKKLLKEKYSLDIVSEEPFKIQSVKK